LQAVLSPMMNGRTSSGDDPFSDLSAASPDTQPRQPQLKRKIIHDQLSRFVHVFFHESLAIRAVCLLVTGI
jgi:hypothetical protein